MKESRGIAALPAPLPASASTLYLLYLTIFGSTCILGVEMGENIGSLL